MIFENTLILAAGIGSATFTIIPYVANLIVASRVKEIIKDNVAAKSWFQHKANLFTLLVVFTGGSYSALALVSSNIFGLKIFSCGVTLYELRQLGKMKVIYTVIIENIPQLACQILYSYAIGGQITSSVALAFIASALSITSSTLSWLIERDTSDTKVVQYYLSTQCTLRTAKPKTYGDEDGDEIEMRTFTMNGQEIERDNLEDNNNNKIDTSNMLTDAERQSLIDNSGRTLKLSEGIAEVFGIDRERIEVGQSMINKYGIMTHIVHCVYTSDLEAMEEEITEENDDIPIQVTPRYYISELYESDKIVQDITKVFRSHFILNEDFEVVFQHRVGVYSKSTLIRKNARKEKKRNAMLQRVVSQVGIKMEDDEMVIDRESARIMLNNLFENEGIVNDETKKRKLYMELTNDCDDNNDLSLDRDSDWRANMQYPSRLSHLMRDDSNDSVGLDAQ